VSISSKGGGDGHSPGIRREGKRPWVKLISHDCSQPTASSSVKAMATLGIEQIFTSQSDPKGNGEAKRMICTIKEEVIWLKEFSSFEEAGKRSVFIFIHTTLAPGQEESQG